MIFRDYTSTVTDENSCPTTSATLTITEPANALSIANVPTHVALCYGDNSGAIAITASGGTGAYGYAWSTLEKCRWPLCNDGFIFNHLIP